MGRQLLVTIDYGDDDDDDRETSTMWMVFGALALSKCAFEGSHLRLS